jgi:hypothetical protein
MPKVLDRRRHPRQPLAVAVVINTPTRRNRLGVSKDISRCGARMLCNCELGVGERVDLMLVGDDGIVPTSGAIVRIEPLPLGLMWRYCLGVAFDAALALIPTAS